MKVSFVSLSLLMCLFGNSALASIEFHSSIAACVGEMNAAFVRGHGSPFAQLDATQVEDGRGNSSELLTFKKGGKFYVASQDGSYVLSPKGMNCGSDEKLTISKVFDDKMKELDQEYATLADWQKKKVAEVLRSDFCKKLKPVLNSKAMEEARKAAKSGGAANESNNSGSEEIK